LKTHIHPDVHAILPMNPRPIISIVMPAYNGEDFIAVAVSSVLRQTYPQFELVVVDDASTDRTATIVNNYSDPRIRFIQNEHNLGLVANLNKGFRASRGELVCWLNQDDFYYDTKLARQYEIFRSNATLGACFCQKDDVDLNGRLLQRFNPTDIRISEEDHLVQLFGGCYLAAPSVMLRREVFNELGGFDSSYSISFDYDIWFRLKKRYEFSVIYESLMAFRHHEGNLSSEKHDDIITSECAGVVKNALAMFSIEEIYPFLRTIAESNQKQIETSACLLSLARLIWKQKKWNRLMVAEVLQLVDHSLSVNPELLEAYVLTEQIDQDIGGFGAIQSKYSHDAIRLSQKYQSIIQQLQTAFGKGDQAAVNTIMLRLYAMCPSNGDPYYQIAELFYRMGDLQRAREYCSHALKLNQDHIKARNMQTVIKDEAPGH
jgi:glycosyltransferase involved in cell wall biosynthesis